MGGRGGFFKSFEYDKSKSYSSFKEAIYSEEAENSKNDEDTKLEHDGLTKKLLDKNIHIKQSTDNFRKDVLMPNINKVNKLSNKYLDTSRVLKQNDKEFGVRADKLPNNTVACFRSYADSLSNMRIVLNKDIQFANKHTIESSVKQQIKENYWTKCDDENLASHSITHEFGHYVQRVLMEREKHTKKGSRFFKKFEEDTKTQPHKYNEIQSKYYEEHAQRALNSIDNLQYKLFKTRFKFNDMSDYGRENACETFAEAFAELNNYKNHSNFAKAMEIYLKQHLNRVDKKK